MSLVSFMSAKALLEMTQSWYQCKDQLERTRASLQRKEQLMDTMKGELQALRLHNKQLRYHMLCSSCRAYLDGKQPGDTIECFPCPY